MGKRLTIQDFIKKAIIRHGDTYDYSPFNYIDAKTKLEIICKKHGSFWQNPDAHLHSNGCYTCGRESCGKSIINDTAYFIEKSKIVHNDRYDYSKSIYIKNRLSIIITCLIHGDFQQMAMHHLAGKGCPVCALSISNKEIKWLNSLNISEDCRHKTFYINDTLIKPDAFDANNNIVYEFYGDFWHGNPKLYNSHEINVVNKKTFGVLYLKTLEKENLIRQAGYTLITMWENDFNGN